MGETPTYALPYPEDADAPDGAAQMKALALAVEASINVDGSVTSRKWKPTIQWAFQTSGSNLAPNYADIPGASISLTPDVNSYWLIFAYFDYYAIHGGADTTHGRVLLNGVSLGEILWGRGEALAGGIVSHNGLNRTYIATLTGGVAYTAKLQGKCGNAGTASQVGNTHLIALLLAR